MQQVRKALAALAVGVMAAAPQGALAQKEKPGAPVAPVAPLTSVKPVYSAPATFDVEVCNRSGITAAAAISYIPVDEVTWFNEGWFTVEPGACETIATTDNTFFYVYAEQRNSGELFWGGTHAQCVQYPGPFALWDDGSDFCPGDYESVDFQEWEATEPGIFTWYLDK